MPKEERANSCPNLQNHFGDHKIITLRDLEYLRNKGAEFLFIDEKKINEGFQTNETKKELKNQTHRVFPDMVLDVVQSCTNDLQRFTVDHQKMRCYGLGLGLDTFRLVALAENFRKLDASLLQHKYHKCACCL